MPVTNLSNPSHINLKDQMHKQHHPTAFSAMILSVFLFSLMDASVKWLGGSYPTQQIMFFRCAVALVPLMVIIKMKGGLSVLKTDQIKWHFWRCTLGISAMAFAFYAFSLMRLADAISILHTTPIIMTVLSIIFLRERVGLHRWSAVIVGFAGMLLVVRPGSGMVDSGSLYMLIAAILVSCTTIIIRRLSRYDDPVCIAFYFTLTGVMVSSVGIILFGWITPTLFDLVILAAVGILGGFAQYFMTLSYRHAEIAMVAPLKYITIIFGGVFGYFIWSELPDLQSTIGISVIAIAGLYTLHRELVHFKKPAV